MTDYYSVLARAVAQLESKDEASRRALYDRAREAVAARMQAIDPPISDDQLNAEFAALEAAVARIENDIASPVEAVLRAHPHPAPAGSRAPTSAARRPDAGLLRERARRVLPSEPGSARSSEPSASGPMPAAASRRSLSPGAIAGALAAVALIVAAAAYFLWPKAGPSAGSQPQAAAPAAVQTAPVASNTPVASPQPAASKDTPASKDTAAGKDTAASKPPAPSKDSSATRSAAIAPASRPPAEPVQATIPYILRRQVVYFRSTYPVGTLIVIKPQHSLYLVKENSAAVRYSIGIGADCDSASGLLVVARKEGGPSSAQPVIPAADRPSASLPPQPPDGSAAGVPAFYLADNPCRIRATNDVKAIGENPPSNGFQLIADDMLDLYERVPVGTKVVVTN
jgi:lipoprotein-anchoring transpeptidase ErfK/SrfK